ncbi:unnamed protein product [Notodromas monacha]|uniref:Uncharacterized protein n=1 Tax=Notodromas monacha TaxID=399045 RepID=A0A7R9BGL6_9CRUS|nr:unnamed protein product [Notodromas monacha]CAG0913787.1 unnamed protein product [Notodromas monacha]
MPLYEIIQLGFRRRLQYWNDYKLRWTPSEYGDVQMLHVPSDHIWRPDIVLYNNADGNFEVTLATKATLHHNGLVEWKPPAIYKSYCAIDVEYFPYDEQTCFMKFGSWTYDGFKVTLMTKARVEHTGMVTWQPPAIYKSSCQIDIEFFPFDIQTCFMKFGSWTYDGFKVDLRHVDEEPGMTVVDLGIDLSEFYMSVEWDILEVPAERNEKFYTCCDEPYLDITFNITMRRKTLFYTVNLIIPCMGISFLTVLTFYLPSDSGEKVTLSISILISLHVFFLLVVEIIPPTSLVVPLLGKYLIFAMILVSISICVTVMVLNVHFRSPQTHKMAPWVKRVFIHTLPRFLFMRRPQFQADPHNIIIKPERVVVRTCTGSELRECYYPERLVYYDSVEPPPWGCAGPPTGLNTSNYYCTHFGAGPPRRQTLSSYYADGVAGHHHHQPPYQGVGGRHLAQNVRNLHGFSADDVRYLQNHVTRSEQPPNLARGHQLRASASSPPPPPPMAALPPLAQKSPELWRTTECVRFIAEHAKVQEDSTKVKEDWKYVAMVLDRLFLWIFLLAVVAGTAGIILQAPSLYDDRQPIDRIHSEIHKAVTRSSGLNTNNNNNNNNPDLINNNDPQLDPIDAVNND